MSRFRVQEFFPEPKSCAEALEMMKHSAKANDTSVIYFNKFCLNKSDESNDPRQYRPSGWS